MEYMTNRIMRWLADVAGKDSTNEIARRSGLTVSTVHRQRTSGALSPEVVVAIARAYDVNILDALVAQGLLTGADIDDARALDALRDADDQQLVEEIARRLEGVADGQGGIFDEPLAPVTPIGGDDSGALDDVEATRRVAFEDDGESGENLPE